MPGLHISQIRFSWGGYGYSLFQCATKVEKVKNESVSHSVVSNFLQPQGLWPTRLLLNVLTLVIEVERGWGPVARKQVTVVFGPTQCQGRGGGRGRSLSFLSLQVDS